MKYEVSVNYVGRITYVVGAESEDVARETGRISWGDDQPSDSPMADFERIDDIGVVPLA